MMTGDERMNPHTDSRTDSRVDAGAESMSGRFTRMTSAGTVHFMGIGGAGMCALAELVLRGGGKVSGCDLAFGSATQRLVELGAEITEGHDAAHLDGVSGLVVTAAVPSDHPELLTAHERGIPVIKRAQALGQWIAQGDVVGVSGTHGKTTTTAMATEVLVAAGFEPTGFVGGRVPNWGGNLRYGSNDLFVVEADEYDRSFHEITPNVAVVTNVEADHLDIYGDFEGVVRGFHAYLEGLPSNGRALICGDDHGASRLLPRLGARGYTYGLNAGSLLRAIEPVVEPAGTRFTVIEEGVDQGELFVPAPGLHNLRNALGAAGAARWLGASWDEVRAGFAAYGGVGRRFDCLGEASGVVVIDDYAHHPTEVVATVATARRAYPDRRIVAVFQPHLFSRTRDFATDFGFALAQADSVVVTDVFPAREEPIPGVTGELITTSIGVLGRSVVVEYVPDLDDAAQHVISTAMDGDVVLVMGAGSIERLGPQVFAALQKRGATYA
jgi:UDP-N-acetylmuramate--alanine ligase